jgi:hypothetical protein
VQKASADDLDITQWLDDSVEDTMGLNAPINSTLKNTSIIDQNLADTTTIDVPQTPAKKEKDANAKETAPPPKIVGQFTRNKKPTASSSGDAADDMLRQFFGRKR